MDQILAYDSKTETDFYEILGCDASNTTQQILAEYKIRALRLHPDKNDSYTKEAEEQFIKLQTAKQVLTDERMRKCYDKWRSAAIAMPFAKWQSLGPNVHNSMHWIKHKRNASMIDCQPQSAHKRDDNVCDARRVWQRETANELLVKFRNYQI